MDLKRLSKSIGLAALIGIMGNFFLNFYSMSNKLPESSDLMRRYDKLTRRIESVEQLTERFSNFFVLNDQDRDSLMAWESEALMAWESLADSLHKRALEIQYEGNKYLSKAFLFGYFID